jgi:hypothetical protein
MLPTEGGTMYLLIRGDEKCFNDPVVRHMDRRRGKYFYF